MKKWKMFLFAVGLTVLFCGVNAHAAYAEVPVRVGGKALTGYLIEEKTMVSLADFCKIMDPAGGVVAAQNGVTSVRARGLTVSAKGGDRYIEANGRCFYTDVNCRVIDGTLYVPIRPLAKVFDAAVNWDNVTRSVSIADDGGVCASADAVYWDGAVLWLARIIHAESRGEPLLGKIAVGNVVMNRVEHNQFPNTIYSVIFDRKYGVQFTPIASGTIYNDPGAESVRAAKMVLEGTSVNYGILYFLNPSIATNSWIQKNRTFAFAIGNHHFYY